MHLFYKVVYLIQLLKYPCTLKKSIALFSEDPDPRAIAVMAGRPHPQN
jgi:hypothetical protein